MARTLAIATSGPCAGHACDDCATCRRGQCCRRDHPDYQLPDLGEWDGPIHGQLGVLSVDEDGRLVCHACSRAYRSLATHALAAHDLWADEYRAIFGLKATTGLIGPALREIRRTLAETHLKGRTEGVAYARSLTPEERSALVRGKRRRLEQKLDPVNQRVRKDVGRKVSATLAARFAAGELTVPRPRDPVASGRKAGAIRRERFQDPDYRARVARKISETRGGRIAVRCVICGAGFEVVPSTVKNGGGKVCGKACFRELRRRYALAQAPSKRPEVRAKIGAASRQRLHPDYDQTVARLRALAPEALAGVPDTTAEAIRLYYGLEDGRPWTHREVAARFGMDARAVSEAIARGVAGLLGRNADDPSASSAADASSPPVAHRAGRGTRRA
jgi:hypothetical protein